MTFLSPSFLGSGARGAIETRGTAVMPSGPVQPSSSSAVGEFRAGIGDAMSGRVSLLMLDTMVLALILFYYWTRHSQGGG